MEICIEQVRFSETTSRHSIEELQKAYEAIAEAQYKRQSKKRRKKTAAVVVSAIAFLPSLLVTYNLWKRAKRKEMIQKRSGKKYRRVKDVRNSLHGTIKKDDVLFNTGGEFRKVIQYKPDSAQLPHDKTLLIGNKSSSQKEVTCVYMTRTQAARFDCSSTFFRKDQKYNSDSTRSTKYDKKMLCLKEQRRPKQ